MHRLKDSWDKAKILLSQLLCIGAMFTACTDDDTIVQSDKAPLQISVSAKAPAVSRTIIDGSSLPDGSHIGVSVFDADGGDYDGQDYFNLKYTAAGEGEGQSWSTTIPASLSTTMAVVAAYFPYIENDALDLTAVPVETASQTDYMYSGAVAGANMSSPEVTLNMSHALANIHVNIKKGTYTGTGEVSQMAVKAAAFATTATMNIFDGTLDNIDGKGAEFTQKITDAAISAGMVEQDFLVVPDGNSESGNISLSVTVDGKKFTAGIDYDEAFQQGYTYTYNLTLNNEDLKVEAVEVLPWGEKASFDEGLDLYDDEYIVMINIPNDAYAYKHNINGFTGTIDWGDGTITECNNVVWPEHTYATAGDYKVVCEGKLKSIESKNYYGQELSTLRITELISIGDAMDLKEIRHGFYKQSLLNKIEDKALKGCVDIDNFYYIFAYCSSLTEIPNGLFDKCTKAMYFDGAFMNCTSLTSIPVGLFDNNIKVTDFSQTFASTAITEIPEGLFDNCPEVTDFLGVFSSTLITEIPVGLFNHNTKVTSFEYVFEYCENLKEVKEGGLFNSQAEADFTWAFRECTNLETIAYDMFNCPQADWLRGVFHECTNLKSIPKGLFDNLKGAKYMAEFFIGCKSLTEIPVGLFDKCTEVTNFNQVFYNCTKLQSIPEGLFDKCTKATNFGLTFYSTAITEIPVGLFDNCTGVTSFAGTFSNCSKLQAIPEGLFDYNTVVTNFHETFWRCYALKNIPEGLFDHCTEVTSFEGTFKGCTSLETIPMGLFDYNTKVTSFEETFRGEDYNSPNFKTIPEGLFDYNTEVQNFNSTFNKCEQLQAIPNGLFAKNTKVTNFGYTFYGCASLTAIPVGLFDKNTKVTNFGGTFANCDNITAIPAGLFDYNIEVTSFNQTFGGDNYNKMKFTEIPAGLFDKCTKVTDFGRTFAYCTQITSESPYTIINVNGQDVKVHLYERANYSDYFTAPTSYNDCFIYCNTIADLNSIPEVWK